MRKTIAVLVVIGLAWLGYITWPLYELSVLVRAIDARDVGTVVRYVNFDRVQASLTEQIASDYIRKSRIQPGPLAQQAVVGTSAEGRVSSRRRNNPAAGHLQ